MRRRAPDRWYRRAADAWFVVDVLRSRMTTDRQRLALPPGGIDAEQLASEVRLERHSERADEFFGADAAADEAEQRLEAHLVKPFSDPVEAANHLAAWAALVEHLGLARGMTVLDFGCGNGWVSRLLLQLGCEVILCDVSPQALELARESFRRSPPLVVGAAAPRFLLFDGHRLDLDDRSVDRIICFDAFHHVPNHDVVLGEMFRVLADDGIAGFHEPGPDHSRKPGSQFEMANFGFLERDIRIKEIERLATAAGFADLRLTVAAPNLAGLGIGEYDRILRFGRIPLSLRRLVWHSAADTRLFYLAKQVGAAADSRQGAGLDARITLDESGADPAATGERVFDVRLENTGTTTWLDSSVAFGGVWLGAHRFGSDGELADLDFRRWPLPRPVVPGDAIEVTITLPRLDGGRLVLDLVAEQVSWFAKYAATPVDVPGS